MELKELIKNENLLKALDDAKFITATEIQEKVIPFILEGNDVLGQSQTGTGKTLAFALPMLNGISENKEIQTLILSPTRELAIQIKRDIDVLAKYTNISITCVYGSSSIESQTRAIKRGTEIVVGTPGRVKDLIKRKVLRISKINYFVLDEADEMLNMGFKEDLEFIFKKVNKGSQVMLFSATMPDEIKKIAENYMNKDYKLVSIDLGEKTAKNVSQEYYLIDKSNRLESLCRVIDFYNPKRSIIFCRTKRNADLLFDKLLEKGYNAGIIHGDITQGERIATLDKFKAGLFNYLIATDVAARGIHVSDIDIVFNYNLPDTYEAYVHRIGRTGRVDKSGIAVTLIEKNEQKIIKGIEKFVNVKIDEKNIPKEREIMENRVKTIVNDIDNYKNGNYDESMFNSYIDSLDETEKSNIINELLNEKLNESIGSDFKVNINSQKDKLDERKKKRNDTSTTRIFITIGKLDNVEKRTFLSFLEKTANVKEGTFTCMEIMPKFSFMNVDNKSIDVVMKKCNNTKYNGRLIRIEKAKK